MDGRVGQAQPGDLAVDALRQIVFRSQGFSEQTMAMLGDLGLGIQIGGRTMTVWNDVLVAVAFGLVMNVLALYMVSLPD